MELSNRENWRSIALYLNYEFSSVGRDMNVNAGKILKPSLDGGCYKVDLYIDGKGKKHLVHRIVACEFIENLEDKPVVDHCDGNKTNNCVSNLRWATKSENGMNRKPQRNT